LDQAEPRRSANTRRSRNTAAQVAEFNWRSVTRLHTGSGEEVLDMQVSRRSMLRAAGGTAAAAVLSPTLAGCGKKKSKNTTTANTAVKMPAYIPYSGVKPDLPGDTHGVLPAFFKYPASPVQASSSVPAKGGSITGFSNIYAAVPPPLGKNAFWQALNKQLGVNLKMNMVAAADYVNKIATLVAGNELPDLASLSLTATPNLPQLLASRFADLTEFLSGDAIKDYPFLANITTDSWKRMVYNGGIYGLPIPRSRIGNLMFVRDDILKAKGLSNEPKSFAEFRELCKGLTDRRHNKFAIGRQDSLLQFIQGMLGKPNTWYESGGKLTNNIELDETRKAIDAIHTLYKDGSFHPDSFSATTVLAKQWMFSGTVALNRDGYKAWSTDILATLPDREHTLGAMLPPGFDGGPGTVAEGNSTFGLVAVKKADKAKVKEVLAIANWLAAPFGTAEFLARKYGVAGTDYTLKGTDPILTSRGVAELALPINYLVDAPDTIYDPGDVALVNKRHAFFEKQVPLIVPDPIVGLYSQTDSTKGPTLTKVISGSSGIGGIESEVYQGRKSLADWDAAVKDWQRNGGNTIRAEYEKAYQQLHG